MDDLDSTEKSFPPFFVIFFFLRVFVIQSLSVIAAFWSSFNHDFPDSDVQSAYLKERKVPNTGWTRNFAIRNYQGQKTTLPLPPGIFPQ